MNKNLIAAFSLFLAFTAFGQTKKITLEDGVLQQYRAFRPDQMLGFQWIPNANKYIYFENLGQKLMSATTADTKATELVSLSELNKTLGTNFRGFFGIEWKDANTFILNEGTKFYEYNIAT